MAEVADSPDRWFATQVLPLEGTLTRYLRRAWRDQSEIDDLRQEIYVRVYESAMVRIPPLAGPFVFAVARNLLIDRMRRSQIVSIDLMADLERLNVLSDEIGADRVLSGRQELARLHRATLDLPPRCREVFRLRKIEGLSQREVAERLEIAEGTVEKQVAKAMRALASGYFGGGADEMMRSETRSVSEDETGSTNRV
jgi:RNA polymerase sigma factor (sigma-70 family)